jgi:hypothetical protein
MTPAQAWRAAALAAATTLCALGAAQMTASLDGARLTWLYEDPMVALRSGAHFVAGHGPGWNPGERVEGYASLAWTLLLGLAHAVLGMRAPMAVLALNAALVVAVLLLAERLLVLLQPAPRWAAPVLWASLVPCFDLVFWAVNGFETTLLTAVWLLAAWRIARASGHVGAGTAALLALVPLLRGDGVLGLARPPRAAARMLLLSLAPFVAHLVFRRAYYGTWWPAPAIVSVVDVPTGVALGVRYVVRFLLAYGGPLLVAIAGVLVARDRRRALLLGALAVGALGVLLHPGPALPGSAPLAHFAPVVLALAAAGALDLSARDRRAGLAAALAVVLPAAVWAARVPPTRLAASEPSGAVTGTLIARHTDRAARVGLLAPGSVAYFSDRRCIDLLGGLSPAGGLEQRPDLVVVHLPAAEVAARAHGRAGGDRMDGVVSSVLFREEYLPHALPVLDRTTVYFHADSPERARMGMWRMPPVTR